MKKRRSDSLLRGSFIFIFFFISFIGRGQDPIFIATASSTRVLQNSVFEVQFELQNASGNDFIPPDFKDFRYVGGPVMGSSTMIINGKITRSQSWSYSLLATTPGRLQIGSATVIAGRRKLATKTLTIDVLAADDAAASGTNIGTDAVKLVAFIEPGDYYPGQQVVLQYKLLFTQKIQSVTTLSEDDYSGFFIQNFNSFSKEATYETVNGATFASRVIKAVALFPHQSGTYTIDPMVMMVGINSPYPGTQGFFTMRRTHDIQIASEPLTIRIKPLPQDQSSSDFSGAVGQYSLSTIDANSTMISTDDDFSMKIVIKGNGDARRWDPPSVVTDGPFEMYDPKIIEDNLKDSEGSILHSRIIEYTMIPQQAGDYTVYIPFTYFNPESGLYETIQSDTIYLHVSQGNLTARHIGLDSLISESPRPLKKVSNIKTDDRFWLSIPHLTLFGLLLGGVAWGTIVSYRRKKDASVPEAERLRSASSRHARQQLDLVLKAGHIHDQEIYEKVTEVYYKYLSEKFNILPADLDEDKILARFKEENIPEHISERAIRFYHSCLSVRYGGLPGGFSPENMITECKAVIDQLDSIHHPHI